MIEYVATLLIVGCLGAGVGAFIIWLAWRRDNLELGVFGMVMVICGLLTLLAAWIAQNEPFPFQTIG